jgi:hypothetical protein
MDGSGEPQVIRRGFGSALRFVPVESFPERPRERVSAALARATDALAQDFRGVTSGGTVAPGLFPIVATGTPLRPILDAANAFRDTLNAAQRRAVAFDVGSESWRSWHNMHVYLIRHGVCMHDLDPTQRSAALALLRETLSASGFENARDVMKLNEHVAELTGRTEEFGEWYYFISLFGEPSATEPWGWQIDGHHLIINCFILGDQMVLTPYFSGSEPVSAASGKYAGTRVFHEDEALGLALMKNLSGDQQRLATVGAVLPRDVLGTAQMDNLELPYAGIRADGLSAAQRAALLDVTGLYVGRMRPGHAGIRMDEVKKHLDETYFAWIGECNDASPFYYRIHSPVILIEFDHLPGIVYDNEAPSRSHIHTVVRTPNGNDYGRDFLRQHYEQHDHASPASPHRR